MFFGSRECWETRAIEAEQRLEKIEDERNDLREALKSAHLASESERRRANALHCELDELRAFIGRKQLPRCRVRVVISSEEGRQVIEMNPSLLHGIASIGAGSLTLPTRACRVGETVDIEIDSR